MYTSRNRYKNHDPCGIRQLIKLSASIKCIFEKEHVAKLFSILLRINLLYKTEIYWHQGEVITSFAFTATPVL